MAIRNIGVFSGSRIGSDPDFSVAAERLGVLLAEHGLTMVYGGGRMGLMGSCSEKVMENGGKTIGIVPEIFSGLGDRNLVTEVINVSDLSERKKVMEEMSDAFIVLPGGMGTLDEYTEMIVGRQIGRTAKASVVINTNHFFDPLMKPAASMLPIISIRGSKK